MSSMTIHSLDTELAHRLSEEARRRKMSKNKLIKEILARSLGMEEKGRFTDDYREFCGVWTVSEKAAFEKAQADNAEVDEKDWQ